MVTGPLLRKSSLHTGRCVQAMKGERTTLKDIYFRSNSPSDGTECMSMILCP